ncbi:hypothetical protein P3T23_004512 [Paraburkholderia sp. GAS448]|uniref:hypothetical protein n=1 Tax=Paraburkholderia sp. GAS448 TaxID=3035136 RepID=UPI003D1C1390
MGYITIAREGQHSVTFNVEEISGSHGRGFHIRNSMGRPARQKWKVTINESPVVVEFDGLWVEGDDVFAYDCRTERGIAKLGMREVSGK